MFIGKYTRGIPTSGSDTISRFAIKNDGSIIDLGFTTTNEEGETVFLSTVMVLSLIQITIGTQLF